ncbi:MAG: hypothetical protein LH491_03545 [Pseudoxanthomonas sp.]|nr:hypothetical protein [Pseudoxanthomonas sp.]
MLLFKVLGVGLALYTAYGAVQGEIIAKSGPGARRVRRAEAPRYFWAVIAIYGALALALLIVF